MQLLAALDPLPSCGGGIARCDLYRPAIGARCNLGRVAQVLVGLGFMTCLMQHLHVAVVVRATVDQCVDVVELESGWEAGHQAAACAAWIGEPAPPALRLECATAEALHCHLSDLELNTVAIKARNIFC